MLIKCLSSHLLTTDRVEKAAQVQHLNIQACRHVAGMCDDSQDGRTVSCHFRQIHAWILVNFS